MDEKQRTLETDPDKSKVGLLTSSSISKEIVEGKPTIKHRVVKTAQGVTQDETPNDRRHLGTGDTTRTAHGLRKGISVDIQVAVGEWKHKLRNPVTQYTYARFVQLFLKSVRKPLAQISEDDVVQFVNKESSWHNRHMALVSIKSFLEYTLKRPPNLTRIDIGQKPEPQPIAEPSAEEMVRLAETIDALPLVENVAMLLLRETGHRRNAILNLPRTSVQLKPTGPVIVFPAQFQKRGASPVCPISQGTYDRIQELLKTHNHQLVLAPHLIWKQRPKWIYALVLRVAKQAGVSVRMYPHLFRHMKALQLRRMGAKDDTVLNTLGWRDTTMYNTRYGRRQAYETAEEARQFLAETESPPGPMPEPPKRPDKPRSTPEIIGELAALLSAGKIDPVTYQASLAALMEKQGKNSGILSGYS